MVEALRPGGLAILNADDENVVAMRNRTSEKVVTFGRSNSADYFATDISTTMSSGLSLTLKGPCTDLKIRTHFTGEHFWVSITAAAVAALELGIDQKMVQQRMASFQPAWDRCHPFHTPDGPTFLVDTCKAPLYSLDLAFSTLASAQGTKKIVVGQLADHPGNSKMAARKARRLAEARADELIFVGHSGKRLGLSDRELASGRYSLFERIKELACYLKETATEDDVILLKSASILHLERVAMAWTTHVRCWKERCGKDGSCMKCGRYGLSYSVHRGVLPEKICRVIANRLNEQEQNTADGVMVRH